MAFEKIRSNARAQTFLGFIFGLVFGFLFQKGGITNYDVIMSQLLLIDFTLVKFMFSAILVGMIGIYIMKLAGLVRLHIRRGSVGSTICGGLILGAGFAILGYCPGSTAAAFGSGAIDGLMGMIGITIGAGIFARLFPALDRLILRRGPFPAETIPELIGIRPGIVVVGVAIMIIGLFYLLAILGL